jgi:hypothetical protein
MSELIVKRHRLHDKQRYILANRKRFNVLKSGRRFGKSALSINLLVESVLKGHYVGFWYPTYRDGLEVWDEVKDKLHSIISKKDEAAKMLRFINGAKADFWSMDDPNSGRGRKYHRVIMDECEKALKFQEAWEQAIAPTLTDFGGDAYFLSTPKFGDTYFKKLCKFEATHDNWRTFVFTTYDNPHMKAEEIDLMRATLPPQVFECEYLAMDLDGKSPSPFAFHFDPAHHISDRAVFDPSRRIIMSIDFNLQPFACTFSHVWEDRDGYHDVTFDEIQIEQGSVPAMADEIRLRYREHLHKFEITGDYMGNRGDIAQRDNASLYLQLIKMLNIPKSALKLVPNPTHENSKADVNYLLWKAKSDKKWEFIINPSCKSSIFDFQHVQWDDLKGQITKKDRSKLDQRGDFIDCSRYRINTYWKKHIIR